MFLFIDTASLPSSVILYDKKKERIDSVSRDAMYNEASSLMPKIDDLLAKNNVAYDVLKNIVVVNGPGSFTGVRTTTILVNTLAFLKSVKITPLSYFELFEENDFPRVKTSSKRDVFIQKKSGDEVEILSNDGLKEYLEHEKITTIYGEKPQNLEIKVYKDINYDKIMQNVALEDKKRIDPLYIKKPNIS